MVAHSGSGTVIQAAGYLLSNQVTDTWDIGHWASDIDIGHQDKHYIINYQFESYEMQ